MNAVQAELNRSLRISLDDLAQEGSLGLFGCIESCNSDSGNLFLTYAAPAIRNAMIDYIRSQNVSFEVKNLNNIISLFHWINLQRTRCGASIILLLIPPDRHRSRFISHRSDLMISIMRWT